jgi:hypothetical protein
MGHLHVDRSHSLPAPRGLLDGGSFHKGYAQPSRPELSSHRTYLDRLNRLAQMLGVWAWRLAAPAMMRKYGVQPSWLVLQHGDGLAGQFEH